MNFYSKIVALMTNTFLLSSVFSLSLLSCFSFDVEAQSLTHYGIPLKPYQSNRLVISIQTEEEVKTVAEVKSLLPEAEKILLSYKKNGESFYTTLVRLHSMGQSLLDLATYYENQSTTNWIYPLFFHEGNPMESDDKQKHHSAFEFFWKKIYAELSSLLTPNDPDFSKQYHHQVINSLAAFQLHTGDPAIIVAVTDAGTKLDHEDLENAFWQNKNEIPDNQIDDDQNGFIDDVNGWDFSDDDHNPNPGFESHGTIVSGVISAQLNNHKGVVGVAPGVKLMPLRFFGGKNEWTSEIVLNSYKYAADNGAKIINTSYNIDNFAKDPIYLAALDYVYQKGLLVFVSAGNYNYLNPRRCVLDQILLVTGTTAKDEKSKVSNFGRGMDLASPSEEILSTSNSGYAKLTGTSMSSPSAAGVAALIWSKNPSWNKEQVAAKLLNSTDQLREKKYQNLLGVGRLNAFRALSNHFPPPHILGISELMNVEYDEHDQMIALFDSSSMEVPRLNAGLEKLTLEFKHILDLPSEWQDSLGQLQLIQLNGAVIKTIPLSNSKPYFLGTNQMALTFEKLLPGRYRFILFSNNLKDPFGQLLDGDFDGLAGGDFIREFLIE